jgi:hypothetical protein
VLFQQPHIGDGHAPIHRLEHVVDGEQGNLREPYKSTTWPLQACSLDPFSAGLVGQNWDKPFDSPSLSLSQLISITHPPPLRLFPKADPHHTPAPQFVRMVPSICLAYCFARTISSSLKLSRYRKVETCLPRQNKSC